MQKFLNLNITLTNEIFNKFMSCSSSQKCNKEIFQFLIESTKNDNQLLGLSYVMGLLIKESYVAVLFRNG